MRRSLVLFLLLSACSSPSPRTEGPPNVVLLFADDLGYGDLSSYGHPTIRTPRLDALAAEGLRFTSFYAGAPSCTPSRAALMTGRYGVRAGLGSVLMPASAGGLADGEVTVAEVLKTAGYETMMIGKWHLGHTKPEHEPVAQGFDHAFHLPYSHDMLRPFVATDVPLRFRRDGVELPDVVRPEELTTRYTGEAVRFLETPREAPFFLYLAYSMPHLPIAVPDSVRGRSAAGLYGDTIERIDWSVGQILAALERAGVAGQTLVVFTSDNGPWLDLPDRMLADGVERWHAGSPGPLRGWKGNSYEGGMRVPAIVRWPGVVEPGRSTAEPASVLDVLPTLAAAAGVAMPTDRVVDGRDLTSLLEGSGRPGDRPFFYVNDSRVEAVRTGRWKARRTWHLASAPVPGQTPPVELFDLEIDPSERYDRSGELPDVAARLAALLDAARDSLRQ